MAGVVSVLGAVLIGVPIGLLAGLAGGWVDALISRIADAMLSVPFLILAIALAAFLGPALENAMLAIAITASPVFVRLARGMALDAKSTDWVEAARALGNPPWRAGAACMCCRTSSRRCWCRRRWPSPRRSSPRPRCASSASASSRRRRAGAPC